MVHLGDLYNVHVDGKKVGVLVSGKAPTELALPPGKHSVKLQRGLRGSERVEVIIKPGQTAALGYQIGLGIFRSAPSTLLERPGVARLTEIQQNVEQLLAQLQASEHDKFAVHLYRSRREYRSACERAGKSGKPIEQLGRELEVSPPRRNA